VLNATGRFSRELIEEEMRVELPLQTANSVVAETCSFIFGLDCQSGLRVEGIENKEVKYG